MTASIFKRASEEQQPKPAFNLSEAPAPQQIFQKVEEEQKQEPQPPQEPSKLWTEEIGRHLARTLARGFETAAGTVGDIREAAGSLGQLAGEKLRSAAGKPPLTEEQKIEKKQEAKKYESIWDKALNLAPTSRDVREGVTKKLTGEELEPRTSKEEKADEITQLVTSLFVGGPKNVKGLLKAAGIGAATEGAGETVKALGGSEKAQNYTKMGTLFLTSFIGKNGWKSAEKEVGRLYNAAESALPEGATINATKLTKNLTALRDKVSKGTLAPSEKFVVDEIDRVLHKVKNGQLAVDEAWAANRSLNEKLKEFVYSSPDKAAKSRARKLAKGISSELNDAIVAYGETNPKFLKAYQDAQQAFGTLAKSRVVSETIADNFKKYGGHTVAHVALGTGAGLVVNPAATAVGLGITGATAGAGALALKGSEIAYRAMKNPSLRKHYLNVLTQAAAQDTVALHKSIADLDKALKEDPPTMQLYKEIEAIKNAKKGEPK